MGHLLQSLTRFGEVASRTVVIETSIKYSTFAFLLAKLHFGDYFARAPAVVSALWMALAGSILAVTWTQVPLERVEFQRCVVKKPSI